MVQLIKPHSLARLKSELQFNEERLQNIDKVNNKTNYYYQKGIVKGLKIAIETIKTLD